MTVYVIAQVKFIKEEYYRRYQSRFAEVFKPFEGRLLVADEKPKVLDGEFTRDKVVMMEFPDEGEAMRFLDSPAYQEISRDRILGAETLSLLVKGLPSPM
jgi:uncharacterized protein (DUF1330 family)